MSRTNPHVAARNNAQNLRKQRLKLIQELFVNNFGERDLCRAHSTILLLSLFILRYASNQGIRKYLYSNAIPSMLLIDISIPNVNIDTPSACIWRSRG